MSGKISVGVRRMVMGVRIRMTSAITTNVYGRLRARATIHMNYDHSQLEPRHHPTNVYGRLRARATIHMNYDHSQLEPRHHPKPAPRKLRFDTPRIGF